jgi:D-alanyl-D-alanine dipeptidase
LKLHAVYFIFLVLLLAGCERGFEETKGTKEMEGTKGTEEIKGTIRTEGTEETEEKKHVSYLEAVFKNCGLVNIHDVDSSIHVDLRYASTNNFLKMDVYDGLLNAYFNCETATKLSNAQYFLKQAHPNLSLIVLDAARPQQVQQLMWDSLHLPADVKYNYLAPPYERSMHNYGCAVDVTIIDLASNTLLDMGSGFDFFGKLSEPVYEWKFLRSGELSKQAYENRLLLRRAMLRAKFIAIHSEWWHFSSYGKAEGMAKFKLIK